MFFFAVKLIELGAEKLPAHHDIPRYSIIVPNAHSSMAPFPAINESPIAPMTSMSPGLNLWTLVGFVDDLPKDVKFLQGNAIVFGKMDCFRTPDGASGYLIMKSPLNS